jgi:hypothetical protein
MKGSNQITPTYYLGAIYEVHCNVEAFLFHLYMCWNAISMWDPSGLGECGHAIWQNNNNLRGK